MLGLNDLSLIPILSFESVSLKEGGSSAVYGSGAITGVIELNDKPAFNKPISGSLNIQLGSFNKRTIASKVSLISKKLGFKASLFKTSADNNFEYLTLGNDKKIQNHAQTSSDAINMSAFYLMNSNSYFKLDFWNQNTFRQIPPTTTQTKSLSDLNDISHRFKLKYTLNSKNINLKSQVAFLDEQNNFRDSINLIFTNNKFKKLIFKTDLNYNISKSQNISAGTNITHTIASTEYYDTDKTIDEKDIYLQYQYYKNKNTFQLTVRQSWHNLVNPPLSPLLSYSYQLNKNQFLHIKISKEFRSPTTNELFWRPGGDINLQPEHGWNQELGYNYKFDDTNFISVVFFHRKINNWILWALNPDLNFFQASNISSVRTYGLDLNSSFKIKKATVTHLLNVNYAFTISKNLKDIEKPLIKKGSQLLYVPKHKIGLNYILQYKSWTANLNGQYVSSTRGTLDNLIGYELLDFNIKKSIPISNHNFDIHLSIYNILNKNFRTIERRPMPGRHFELGIKLNLF